MYLETRPLALRGTESNPAFGMLVTILALAWETVGLSVVQLPGPGAKALKPASPRLTPRISSRPVFVKQDEKPGFAPKRCQGTTLLVVASWWEGKPKSLEARQPHSSGWRSRRSLSLSLSGGPLRRRRAKTGTGPPRRGCPRKAARGPHLGPTLALRLPSGKNGYNIQRQAKQRLGPL